MFLIIEANLLDLIVCGRLRDAENLVVVLAHVQASASEIAHLLWMLTLGAGAGVAGTITRNSGRRGGITRVGMGREARRQAVREGETGIRTSKDVHLEPEREGHTPEGMA